MASAYAKTVRTIVNDTFRICGDYCGDGQDGKYWLWDEVHAAVKDAVFNLVRSTGILKESTVIALQENIAVYDLPPNCIRVLRVGIHGLSGKVVLPRSQAEYDYKQQNMAAQGFPYEFFRDILSPGQIGVYPTPDRSGSSFSRDSEYGLLRQLTDAAGNSLPFDDNRALRRVAGVPFVRSGTGNIIREIFSPYGNLFLTFVRTPAFPSNPDQHIDSDIPEYIHKDIKYGAAEMLLRVKRTKIAEIKLKKYSFKWKQACTQIKNLTSYKGVNDNMTPA